MARIRTGADPLAAALADLQHGLGVPVVRGLRVIVQRDVQLVLFAEFVQRIEGVLAGFRHDRLDTHVLGELKRLAAGIAIGR